MTAKLQIIGTVPRRPVGTGEEGMGEAGMGEGPFLNSPAGGSD